MPRTAKDPSAAKELSHAAPPTALSAQAQQDAVSEGLEEYELPRTLITRIAKSAVPENAKMGKDVSLSIVKASTVFINYLAATAHDVAASKQHKSISASDVLKALELLELGDMIGPLQRELEAFRAGHRGEKGRRGKGKAKASASAAGAVPGGKGKEKAPTITIAPRAVSASAPQTGAEGQEGAAEGLVQGEEVDGEVEDEEGLEEEDEIDEDDVEEEGDEVEDEDIDDRMAVEKEEVARDARGLDDAPHVEGQ